jgi:anthranilate synthase component 1
MGYLGYDVVREVEHLPDAARRPPLPDAVVVIGQLAAFDHWRQRVR